MKRIAILLTLTFLIVLLPAKLAHAANGFSVAPSVFDPAGTHLVAAEWERGIGCPSSNASISLDGSTLTPYNDPACPSGDSSDTHVEGLLLAKTGPTPNYAAAQAAVLGVAGKQLMELGYDIRKPGPTNTPPGIFTDPRGSHCGAGAPRFEVFIGGTEYDIGCSSSVTLPVMDPAGLGWERLRWGSGPTLIANRIQDNTPIDIKNMTVDSIDIVFDEGQDASGGPDSFGLAVLDNIDFNGALVGRGPQENKDEDEVQGEDGNGDAVHSDDSASRPESSSLSYEDKSKGMKMQSVNGARSGSVTYTGPCVSYAGDAVMNGNPRYIYTFEACGASALGTTLGNLLGTGIGTFSMTVTGPAGYLYQKSAILTSGYVNIHPH